MPRRTPPQSSLAPDQASEYAQAVVDGKIVAGTLVRAACLRHLSDIDNGAGRGLRWDAVESERVIRFFKTVLTVEVESDDLDTGETISEAIKFCLQPWQCFVIGSLFGWKNKQGYRRFRRAYCEIGKGNGKSPMAAGIGHYMLTATSKLRAEVYAAAAQKDQAMVVFRDAVAMWERSPHLTQVLLPSGQNPVWQLTFLQTSSFFKPLSSENQGRSGIRPYCGIVDEVHEHPDNSVIEMLRAGTKGNRQALIFEITNSGFDRQSVCWAEHEYTAKVVRGDVDNDAWFGFICSLDEGDDPFNDESCWIKANPNIGVSIQLEYIREQVHEARGMPSKEALVRRLHFCEWTEAEKGWVTRPAWLAVEADLRLKDYADEPCWAGLDMSFTKDLTALALVFPSKTLGVEFDAFVEFWTPKDTLLERAKKDRVDYSLWVKQGHIHAPEGKVIRLEAVGARIGELLDSHDFQALAYDRYRHKELDVDLIDLGVEPPMVEHPQGFRRVTDSMLWMPKSFDDLETLVIERKIRVQANPTLRWNVSAAVVRDDPAGTGNRVFDKRKATGRIDGIVALAMAVGVAKMREVVKVDIDDFLAHAVVA